jgi:glucose/arabinose dehydrogenase
MKFSSSVLIVLSTILLTCRRDTLLAQNANQLLLYASGLTSPVCIANAGDSRLFIVDQHGYIIILNSVGLANAQPFLNIHDRVVYGGERGLLGVAFHPQYSMNGYFYVNYTGAGDSTHISRFKVNADNPELADPKSEQKIMTIFQPFENHNGGDLQFDPDGYLYIGLGDGGSGGDPGNRAQNTKTFLGKMLRIDVDNGDPYGIPSTNPFVTDSSVLPEIWATGLRNPWRFSFDRLTHDLWIADVGQNKYEEINFQPASSTGGENYGWKCYEGNEAYASNNCSSGVLLTFPAYTYSHGNECSVTGGYVYRGSTTSPFYGHYFFADYCSDKIWTLHQENGRWIKEDFGQFPGNNFSAFGEDANGEIYVAGLTGGKIYKVIETPTNTAQLKNSVEIKLTKTALAKKIRIDTRNTGHSDLHLSVFDLKGSKLFQTKSAENSFEIDLGFLRSGTYLFRFFIKGEWHTQKIVLAGNN